MRSSLPLLRLGLLLFVLGWACVSHGQAKEGDYSWTYLVPEKDARDAELRKEEDREGKQMVEVLGKSQNIFPHPLTMQTLPIAQLLVSSPPFCELDFDAIKPLILTPREKGIVKEYLQRGGFIIICPDNYPYSQDEFWSAKRNPVIDFFIRELPASDPDFKLEKLPEQHPLFHQYYKVDIGDDMRHELRDNPHSVDMTLVTYRGHPCAFFWGSYTWVVDGKWVALQRPFTLNLPKDPEAYALDINLYLFVMTH